MSIKRNAIANFMGSIASSVAMLLTLPLIVKLLGVSDYGLLTLIMAITGYFAVVDINVTGGSVKYIAEYMAKDDVQSANEVFSFGALFYLAIGAVGALVIYLFAPVLIGWFSQIPETSVTQAILVMRVAALGFFVGQLQVYANSVPQALQRFDVTAKLEAVFGVLVPVLTVALLFAGGGLFEVVVWRVAASALHLLCLCVQISRLLPGCRLVLPRSAIRKQLLSFSGYSYLSRLAALTYAQADKLIVGGMLGMTALTYYSVAAQIAGRITGLSFRLSSVVFPAASAMQARAEMARLRDIYFIATRYVSYLNASAILLLCLFGKELLHYWMGDSFADEAYFVLVFVSLALFFDSLTTPDIISAVNGCQNQRGFYFRKLHR